MSGGGVEAAAADETTLQQHFISASDNVKNKRPTPCSLLATLRHFLLLLLLRHLRHLPPPLP